jgi:hypothetical protein
MFTASIIKAIIVLIMEAVSTSETSINFYETVWRNNEEYSYFKLKTAQGKSCILQVVLGEGIRKTDRPM